LFAQSAPRRAMETPDQIQYGKVLSKQHDSIFKADRCYRIMCDDNTPLQRITCRKRTVLDASTTFVLEADAERVFWVPHLSRQLDCDYGFAIEVGSTFDLYVSWID